MADRLSIQYLAVVGASKDSAKVRFGAGLSVVEGPSDTGKSFIAEAIDFMLGASSLREIPELTGYTAVLMGLALADGSKVTLRRPVTGGNIELYRGAFESEPDGPADSVLRYRHAADNIETLSGYLLHQVGMDGRQLRKNKNNKLVSLSFRDISHLTVIDEISMQAETRPALTGQYTTQTKELSAFRFLLEDRDDSGLEEIADSVEQRKLGHARVGVIDALLDRLREQLQDIPALDALRDQTFRLDQEISRITDSKNGAYTRRDQIGDSRSRVLRLARARDLRHNELAETESRFELLLGQYRSDVERLDLIEEAGSVLHYFDSEFCPYCGAEAQDQRPSPSSHFDAEAFAPAIVRERKRTVALAGDLENTLQELREQRQSLQAESAELRDAAVDLDRQFEEAERLSRPASSQLRSLIAVRSRVQTQVALYGQVQELERARLDLEVDATAELAGASSQMSGRMIDEFSAELVETLSKWGYPHASTVRYDRDTQDVWADGQFRASHGKGVRSLLHAAFTVSLAQYCLVRDLPHPGFVVLDSPLVTYRAPDRTPNGDDHPVAVSELFYRDLAERFLGQAIVMENVDVPEDPSFEIEVTTFTGIGDDPRTGFLD